MMPVDAAPPFAESELHEAIALAFSSSGALAAVDPNHAEREVQLAMALAVAKAIDERSALVVEAGTGVGKTYAYLVPALISGARTLLSTATKTLQDQLFMRDLPRLRSALNLPLTVALLKGRSSYLCLHRLGSARHDVHLPDRFAVRALARIEAWAQTTNSGDLAELEGLDERSSVIPLVTSSRENCLGSECPEHKSCHVMKARRDALLADVVRQGPPTGSNAPWTTSARPAAHSWLSAWSRCSASAPPSSSRSSPGCWPRRRSCSPSARPSCPRSPNGGGCGSRSAPSCRAGSAG